MNLTYKRLVWLLTPLVVLAVVIGVVIAASNWDEKDINGSLTINIGPSGGGGGTGCTGSSEIFAWEPQVAEVHFETIVDPTAQGFIAHSSVDITNTGTPGVDITCGQIISPITSLVLTSDLPQEYTLEYEAFDPILPGDTRSIPLILSGPTSETSMSFVIMITPN